MIATRLTLCSDAGRAIFAALYRGDTLMVPARYDMILGSAVERIAHVARMLGCAVVVSEGIVDLTTRERVEA